MKAVSKLMNISACVAVSLAVPSAFAELKTKEAFSGLKTSTAVDVVAGAGDNTSNGLEVREAEVMFFAPVDPYFNAFLSVAGFTSEGAANIEFHEAYVSSAQLIPSTELKLGRFFLPLGRLGTFHRHEWPFVSTPLVFAKFFGDEGVLDQGGELRTLLPLPIFAELRLGVTSGYELGHSHSAHEHEEEHEETGKPLTPNHYAKLTFFQDVGTAGVQGSINYLGRTDADGHKSSYIGVDVTSKWGDGFNPALIQVEGWTKISSESGEDESHVSYGAYAFAKLPVATHWSLGARVDYLKTEEHHGDHMHEDTIVGLSPVVEWKASEFSSVRLGGDYRKPKDADSEFGAQLQFAMILGEHPAHDF